MIGDSIAWAARGLRKETPSSPDTHFVSLDAIKTTGTISIAEKWSKDHNVSSITIVVTHE